METDELSEIARDESRWAHFRSQHPNTSPDLSGANLEEAHLSGDFSNVRFDGAWLKDAWLPFQLNGASFIGAHLRRAHLDGQADVRDEIDRRNTVFRSAHMTDTYLRYADFSGADFSAADMRGAMFEGSILTDVNFTGANLLDARFNEATLTRTKFSGTTIRNADFAHATCEWTIFDGVDLSLARGLGSIEHRAPSQVSLSTLFRSGGRMANAFLAGTHPDIPVDTLRNLRDSLRALPFDHYSCFISYARADTPFVDILTGRLRKAGIGFWRDTVSLRVGEPFEPSIAEAIGRFDRFLVVLSAAALKRPWVRRETEIAWKLRQDDILPIRLDDALLRARGAFWKELRSRPHIGDFSRWRERGHLTAGIEGLVRDLRRE
jgi:uncharacterized protein YjbI with pentapeptide repeats